MKTFKFLLFSFVHFIALSAYTQTTIILQPNDQDGKDASVTLNAGNNNYDTYQSIVAYTWTNGGNLGKMRGLIEFDLSILPNNAAVIDASLSLYYNPTDDLQSFEFHSGQNDAYIQRITEPWTENLVTWNNQPNSTSVNQIELDASTSNTQNYLDIDVTVLINDMLTAPEGNNGMILKMQNEISPYRSLLFASSDNADSTIRPKLELTYILNNNDSCITIKPGVEGKDASVTLNNASSNYDDYESMVIYTWTNGGNLGKMRALIEFDLSFIPENATLSSSSLSLFYNPTDNIQSFDLHTGNNDAYIQRITESWDESTVNWSNQPGSTTINQVELAASNSGTQNYTNIDVSDLVTDMLDPNNSNYGFIIKMQNEVDPYRSLLFASSDNSNADLHPELELCWNITTAIEHIESKYNIKIFPNPSNGIFNIEINENKLSEFKYEVFNVSGQVLISENSYGNKVIIDLSDFTKGLYFIKLILGKDESVIKRIMLR